MTASSSSTPITDGVEVAQVNSSYVADSNGFSSVNGSAPVTITAYTIGQETTLDSIKDYDGNLHAGDNSAATASSYKYQKESGNKMIATYDGGHSNRLNGAFSGVTDIQGMDFYIAGCAPHITAWAQDQRIQGAYDYLYNTRQNMKPLHINRYET